MVTTKPHARGTALAGLYHRLLPQSLQDWIYWHRQGRAIQDFSKSELDRIYRRVLAACDMPRLNALRAKARPMLRVDHVSAAKYCEYPYWLRYNILRAARLGLHRRPPVRLLEIGSGPGWFLAACKGLGHTAVGLDVPFSQMDEVEAWAYRDIPAAIGCGDDVKCRKRIEPFQPMGLDGTFDLVVGFLVCFNAHKKVTTWGAAEWAFFLEDVRGHLAPQGQLYLELNADKERFPELEYYDRETLRLFQQWGDVGHGRVLVPAAERR